MIIRQLRIKNFRGIQDLTWEPREGVNLIVGPADAGKSTVLAALSLLFSRSNAPTLTEYDYFRRLTSEGFAIEAIVAGIDELSPDKHWIPQGWKDHQLFELPDEDGREAVLVVRVTGTPDLDLVHSIVGPGEELRPFGRGTRLKLPFSEISGFESAFREFRMSQGSLLEKSLETEGLRSELQVALGNASAQFKTPDAAYESIKAIKETFGEYGLAKEVLLGMITPYGASLTGMIGLLMGADATAAIPLALSGQGTRKLAMFALTRVLIKANPLIVIDEPETGLEPYRQRALIKKIRELVSTRGQAFIITHSPTVIQGVQPQEVYRLSGDLLPTNIGDTALARLFKNEPSLFLSRLPVLGEGETEAGILDVFLDHFAKRDFSTDIETLGIHVAPSNGQPKIMEEAEALSRLNIPCGILADNETTGSGLRSRVAALPHCILTTWESAGVRNVEEAVCKHCTWEQLQELPIQLAAAFEVIRVESLYQQVGTQLGAQSKADIATLRASEGDEETRVALSRAMQEGKWFKRRDSARFLATFLVQTGVPEAIETVLTELWSNLKPQLG